MRQKLALLTYISADGRLVDRTVAGVAGDPEISAVFLEALQTVDEVLRRRTVRRAIRRVKSRSN